MIGTQHAQDYRLLSVKPFLDRFGSGLEQLRFQTGRQSGLRDVDQKRRHFGLARQLAQQRAQDVAHVVELLLECGEVRDLLLLFVELALELFFLRLATVEFFLLIADDEPPARQHQHGEQESAENELDALRSQDRAVGRFSIDGTMSQARAWISEDAMAGQTMRILPRTDYDMGGLAASGTATVVIARKLDTSRWREGVILARLHAAPSWPASSTITLLLAPDGYTDEDPGLVWTFQTSTLITFAQGSDTAPAVKIASFPTPFGPLAQLQLKFGLAAGTGAYKPSLSVDLNLKGE